LNYWNVPEGSLSHLKNGVEVGRSLCIKTLFIYIIRYGDKYVLIITMTEREQIEQDLLKWKEKRDKFMAKFAVSMNNCRKVEQPKKEDCFNK